MNESGIIKANVLMGSFWTNYKVPVTETEISMKVESWMMLLKTVPNEEVFNEIARIASEGREYAPNVGQIYAAIKERRGQQKALPADNPMKRMHDEYLERYRSRGLPTMGDYVRQGHTPGEWLREVCVLDD